MIMLVLRLTRWEFFKVRKRWMPWILLVAALLVVQSTLWSFYAAYGNVGSEYHDGFGGGDANGDYSMITITCADILDGTADAKVGMVIGEMREDARKRVEQRRERGNCPDIVEQIAEDRERHREFFVLPGGLANSLGVAHYIGLLLVMILGASTVGAEYGWGTLRTALTRGTGRWQFLGAKSLSLVLLSVAGLLVVSPDRRGRQPDRRFTHTWRRWWTSRSRPVVNGGSDVRQGDLCAAGVRHPCAVPHGTDLIVKYGDRDVSCLLLR